MSHAISNYPNFNGCFIPSRNKTNEIIAVVLISNKLIFSSFDDNKISYNFNTFITIALRRSLKFCLNSDENFNATIIFEYVEHVSNVEHLYLI
jgi:hypothetical protein